MIRPTLQGRAGFNPNGHGPGVNAPFGVSAGYLNGRTMHNGQDYFWLGAASASRLRISTAASMGVYPVVDGPIVPVSNSALGNGFYQQIDRSHRAYFWHLASPVSGKTLKTTDRAATMGATGTATSEVHLHFEIRKAPYGFADRINPEPFFKAGLTAAQKTRYRKIAAFVNRHAKNLGLPTTGTESDGIPGGNYWKLVQGLGRAWKFYDGAVDGEPGSMTYTAEKIIWNTYVNIVAPEPPTPVAPAPVELVPPVVEPEPVEPVASEPVVPEPSEPQPAPVELTPVVEPLKPDLPTGWVGLGLFIALIFAAVASFFGGAL